MRIVAFQIKNYKSFWTSEEIHFEPGFNIIVGENNVGKTALIEALSLRYGSKSHISLLTVPTRGTHVTPTSSLRIVAEFADSEVREMLKSPSSFHVPVPINQAAHAIPLAERLVERIQTGCIVEHNFENGSSTSGALILDGQKQTFAGMIPFQFDPGTQQIERTSDRVYNYQWEQILFRFFAHRIVPKIYLFNAERLNIGESQIGTSTELASNASNLAQVINLLQSSNPVRFQRFNHLVSLVLPQVKYVIAPPVSNNMARIHVWTTDLASERSDLAFPLSESGTGIGQVLAILYVVLNSDTPRTILIDEPQSFLHPGAIRKLFDILKQHPQHQYIISTHSPVALSSLHPEKILVVRKPEAESIVETIDVAETQRLRVFLAEIGAKLSDVFGADEILWVEGPTEEVCFPLIIAHIIQSSFPGTVIVGVVQTGDFEGKYSKTIFEIYTRLSKREGLLPPAVGFIFDREGRTEQDIEDLRRQSKGTVSFLPRRMYENYLLNPHAIASVLASNECIHVSKDDIELWLNENCWDRKYFNRTISKQEKTKDFWLANVHGAKILAGIFQAKGAIYDKVQHNLALTHWLIENAPEDLGEIAQLIEQAMTRKQT